MDTEAILNEIERGPTNSEQLSFAQLAALDEDGEPPHIKDVVEPKPAPESEVGTLVIDTPEAALLPVTGRHQDVRLYLAVLLKTFVEITDAGLVREAPFPVHFGENQTYEPDIVFVSHTNFDAVHESYVEGAPDIIVEVASEESTATDRGEKFVAYEAQGVREYWLVDPIRELVDLYHLGPDGRYDQFRPDTAGRLRSRVLKGFVLDVSRLWRRVLPTVVESVEMVQAMLDRR